MSRVIGPVEGVPTLGGQSDGQLSAVMSHPDFAVAAYALMDGWSPRPEDDGTMSRRLRDVAAYLAGVWALQLAAEPTGLTPTTLGAVLGKTGYGSRNRAVALLAYLEFIGLVEPLPRGVDGRDNRERRYQATPPLRQLFMNRFRRELSLVASLDPSVQACLDRWQEPGVAETFTVANGLYTTNSLVAYDRTRPTLDAISHLNSGLTLLGQIVTLARQDDAFPPAGPVRLNQTELARRSGASRGQVRTILRAAAKAGFMEDDAEGWTHFTPSLREQLRFLMGGYIASLCWCAREAVRD